MLDDSDGVLGLGAPEVSIVRRLDRSGEGEYRLAGARCRLVDVIELLSDTGLGKEMHSVISQGRVESIVTSKPRDRRLLIEEAAGLGKHRKRRRRAQLKLARTQENLDRALDVEREARSRLRPLKRQAEAAELHARLERQTLEARWELARDDAARASSSSSSAQARPPPRPGPGASRSSASSTASPSAARRPRRRSPRRSAQREELSRRCFVAQSAGERVGYRAEAVRAAAATARRAPRQRPRGCSTSLAGRGRRATRPTPTPTRGSRRSRPSSRRSIAIARPSWRASSPSSNGQLERRARRRRDPRRTRSQETPARARAGRGRRSSRPAQQLREAERGVERARREAARVGGELAAVNQFLRSQAAVARRASARSPTSSRSIPATSSRSRRRSTAGCERRSSPTARRRRRCSTASAPTAAGRSVAGAGAGEPRRRPRTAASRRCRAPSASPTTSAAPTPAAALARALLRDDVGRRRARRRARLLQRRGRDAQADGCGRPVHGEVRQAPAAGEERVLAERNRRERADPRQRSGRQAELDAAAALERVDRRARRGSKPSASRRSPSTARRSAPATRPARRSAGSRRAIERRRSAPGRRPERRPPGPADGRAGRRARRCSSGPSASAPSRDARIERLRRPLARDERSDRPRGDADRRPRPRRRGDRRSSGRRSRPTLAADREAGEHVAAELRDVRPAGGRAARRSCTARARR